MADQTIFLPGQLIGPSSAYSAGEGTHIHNSSLFSSIAGPLTHTTTAHLSNPGKLTPPTTTSVLRLTGPLLPTVSTLVLGRITRTNARQATLSILALGARGEHVCRDAFPAVIRQQDIRATEVDKVKVAESFRVGDVVRAVVVSLGNERSYYVSTARNELGVVMAVSGVGNQMVPVSWKEFWDQRTGVRERRKVAKPI